MLSSERRVRRTLIWISVLGGVFITLLAIVLRALGIHQPVPYLTYPGVYLMQAFVDRMLGWIPWGLGDNLISEDLVFFSLNVAGYAAVIFLILRIFVPNRSGGSAPLTDPRTPPTE